MAQGEETQVGHSAFLWTEESRKPRQPKCTEKSMEEEGVAHKSAGGPLKFSLGADRQMHVKKLPEVGKEAPRRIKENSIGSSHRACPDTFSHQAGWKLLQILKALSRILRRVSPQ